MKFSNDVKLIKDYDGTTKQGMVKHKIEEFGLHDGWYGGNLRAVGVFKETPIMALLMEDNVTRALMIDEKDIEKLTDKERTAFGISESVKEIKTIEEVKQLIIDGGFNPNEPKKEPVKQILKPVHRTKRK